MTSTSESCAAFQRPVLEENADIAESPMRSQVWIGQQESIYA